MLFFENKILSRLFLIAIFLPLVLELFIALQLEKQLEIVKTLHIAAIIVIFFFVNFIIVFSLKSIMNRPDKYLKGYVFSVLAIIAFSNIMLFAFLYNAFGVLDSTGNLIQYDYLTSFYFSIVTWTTLGYGDLHPIEGLRMVAALEALMGYIYMSTLIGVFIWFMGKVYKQEK
ncbi:potassium channel family protein [Pseudomonadota bacterium]